MCFTLCASNEKSDRNNILDMYTDTVKTYT